MSSHWIADRMGCIESSGIRRIWQMAASMKDPVNFSIGEPDFDAPRCVKEAVNASKMLDETGRIPVPDPFCQA